jgi:hypothetical protein
MLHAQKRAEHVGIEGGAVAFGGLFRHRAGPAFGSGVIDGHVQATEVPDGLVDDVTNVILAAHVGTHVFSFGAEGARSSVANALPVSSRRPETTIRAPS